ncbi:hypothetical protein PVAND_009765 [Polypedilum vanderplanki]|nr:hypothetical protein PVAND_009765 [Polypedilum vanderplanki]
MNAPLYSGSGSSYTKFSVDGSINWWQRQGAPSSKLVVGMAAFGRSFTLANPSNNGVGATIVGPGNGGPFLDQSGTLGYNEICHLMKSGGWTRVGNHNKKFPMYTNIINGLAMMTLNRFSSNCNM